MNIEANNVEDAFWTDIEPSFESALYWKDKKERSLEICEMVKRFKFILDNGPEDFYDYNYPFCKRAISLLEYYNDDRAFEDVFDIYCTLCIDEDEWLEGTCDHYLNRFVGEKHQDFLFHEWSKSHFDLGADDLTSRIFCFLLKSGYRSAEIEAYAKEVIWSDDFINKSVIAGKLEGMEASREIGRRLKFIAPMVKYGPQERWGNPYVDEWIELSEAYLKYEKGICFDKDYKNDEKIKKKEDDEFLIRCLGIEDKRVSKIQKSYSSQYDWEASMRRIGEVAQKREEIMKEEFLDRLPDDLNRWMDSPFVEERQKLEMEDYLSHLRTIKRGTKKNITKKVGRNDPCICGSGKKYKKCCLK